MKTIIAIGGGSFQRKETLHIDRYAIALTKKIKPKVLFLPCASHDDQGYAKRMKQYMRSIGCEVEALRLLHTKLTISEIRDNIRNCDILYIGAGNFGFLMDTLKNMDLCETMKEAYENGVICVGNSAGASLFFRYGYSDVNDDGTCFDYIKGLGIIDGAFCPHAQDEKRSAYFHVCDDMKRYSCRDQQALLYQDDVVHYLTNDVDSYDDVEESIQL